MPPACPVETHVGSYYATVVQVEDATGQSSHPFYDRNSCSSERETPPGKPVASQESGRAFGSSERETPPGKPVASKEFGRFFL